MLHDSKFSSKRKKLNDWKRRGTVSKAKVVKPKIMASKKVSEYPTKDLPLKPLLTEKDALKWWDLPPYKGDIKWKRLNHNGICFPPPYKQHHVQLFYKGEPVELNAKHEKYRHTHITDFRRINFRPIQKWAMKQRELEKEKKKDPAYRKRLKAERAEMDEIYGYAIVDGVREKIGNFRVEPPGLFRGRGDHPKAGVLKKRLRPSQITLNIGKDEKIPPCPIEGEQWGGIIHDPTVTYIAKWVDNVNQSYKMVYLHASSRFKGQADMAKYEKARKLKKRIASIREDYTKKLTSTHRALRELATCVWIIDILSIRVGNEKDTEEAADTVGVCSFRVEHLTKFEKTA